MKDKNQSELDKSGANDHISSKIRRRDILKGIASLPVFGAFLYSWLKKKSIDHYKKGQLLSELNLGENIAEPKATITLKNSNELIRVGIIGFGNRGEQLARSLGFAIPQWIENQKKRAEQNKFDKTLEDWLAQENLNVAITGICDVFDNHAEKGMIVANNNFDKAGEITGKIAPKRYRTYLEMLASQDIDAVIITIRISIMHK